jgi:hypothetical protein
MAALGLVSETCFIGCASYSDCRVQDTGLTTLYIAPTQHSTASPALHCTGPPLDQWSLLEDDFAAPQGPVSGIAGLLAWTAGGFFTTAYERFSLRACLLIQYVVIVLTLICLVRRHGPTA